MKYLVPGKDKGTVFSFDFNNNGNTILGTKNISLDDESNILLVKRNTMARLVYGKC